jgi:Flp pilus assembly pilin Flp
MAQRSAGTAGTRPAGRFRRDAQGTVSIEYALIGVMVAIMLIPALMAVKSALSDMPDLHRIADVLTNGTKDGAGED